MELELQQNFEAVCLDIDSYFCLFETDKQMIFPILCPEAKKIIKVIESLTPNESMTYEEISIKTGYPPQEIELICTALLPHFDLTFVEGAVTYWEPDYA